MGVAFSKIFLAALPFIKKSEFTYRSMALALLQLFALSVQFREVSK